MSLYTTKWSQIRLRIIFYAKYVYQQRFSLGSSHPKMAKIVSYWMTMPTHVCCSCHSTDSMALHQAEIRCETLPDGPNPVCLLIRWPDREPSHGKVSSSWLHLWVLVMLFVMVIWWFVNCFSRNNFFWWCLSNCLRWLDGSSTCRIV